MRMLNGSFYGVGIKFVLGSQSTLLDLKNEMMIKMSLKYLFFIKLT